jgi:hypothetical protein
VVTAAPPVPGADGPLMFVRYAYPPNALGYCGPSDFAAFREYAVAGVVDRGLIQLAQTFAGAWPYLELIAHGCGIGDPLDRRVVEAYWVGNDLLDKIPVTDIGESMQERFRARIGGKFPFLAEGVLCEPGPEMARLTLDGASIAREIAPLRHLDLVNHRVEHPGPVALLG